MRGGVVMARERERVESMAAERVVARVGPDYVRGG